MEVSIGNVDVNFFTASEFFKLDSYSLRQLFLMIASINRLAAEIKFPVISVMLNCFANDLR